MKKSDILIVDDDPQVAKSNCRALNSYKLKIRSAQNGQDALKILSDDSFRDAYFAVNAMAGNYPNLTRSVAIYSIRQLIRCIFEAPRKLSSIRRKNFARIFYIENIVSQQIPKRALGFCLKESLPC